MNRRYLKKNNDGKPIAKPDAKEKTRLAHPVLQLQQMVGNRAVTNLIQRHGVHDISVELGREGGSLGLRSLNIGMNTPEEERQQAGR